MAKAKEVPGPDRDADVLEWSEKVLCVRFEEIMEKRGAAIGAKQIEGVHDMRVATRRLRSALRDFAGLLKKKPLSKIRKDLKLLADALGAARDEDVALVALEKRRKKAREKIVREGIAELIRERKDKRERAQLDLLEMLSANALEDLRKRFERTVGEAAGRKKSTRSISFGEAGRRVVSKSVREFCDLSGHIYEPFNDESLHKLRIAAKRLRYAIELYADCWGEKIKPFAEQIADMQNFLGEVRDADVWLESLSRKLKDGEDSNPAHLWLLSEFVEKRTKNYRAALRLWSVWKENDFIERLKTTVSQTVL